MAQVWGSVPLMKKVHLDATSLTPIALFRYSVVSQVLARTLGGTTEAAAVRAVAAQRHVDLLGSPRQVAVRTLQRWMLKWRQDGVTGLEPQARKKTRSSEVLPPAFVEFVRVEKTADPRASIPELLRRARLQGVIAHDLPIDRVTVWRLVCRLGLPTRIRPTKHEGDARRWRYPHRMQCVLCDGKHFRAGTSRAKRVALFFIDNATRLGLDVIVGSSESTELFLTGLYRVVRKHGLMDGLYLDQGAGFKSNDTLAVATVGLKAWLIHGQVGYPEGRGAVERFNRTAQAAVLRGLDGAADVDPDCVALTLRLQHYLRTQYNLEPHQALDGESPQSRWEQGRPLRWPKDEQDLRARFVVREQRLVSADHVIQYGGKHWEAPRGLARRRVEVVRHVLDGHLSVPHRNALVRLHEVDVHANATDRRGYLHDNKPFEGEGVPTTAAMTAFDNDFGPVVGPDGGFADHRLSADVGADADKERP